MLESVGYKIYHCKGDIRDYVPESSIRDYPIRFLKHSLRESIQRGILPIN